MRYDPQKALLVDRPPTGDGWIHELKLDGFRMGVLIDRGDVRVISRRGTDYTREFPEVVRAARRLRATKALLDGEVVVLDEHGVSRFQLLQQLGESRRGLAYFAFDLLSLDGESLTGRPLEERKRSLRKLVGRGAGLIRYNEHSDEDGAAVFAAACKLGAEGIISKKRDGIYRIGARSADWQKIKCIKRQELVIGGFTDPSGSRVGVGSILVGYYEDGALRFAGKVGTGTGWSAAFGTKLRRDLEAIETDRTPFDPPPRGWLRKNAHWVKPKLVVEVEFTEWTADGRVRHPSLKGFRRDKKPSEVLREREVRLRETPASRASGSRGSRRPRAPESPLLFPRIRVTRQHLRELYEAIAEWALPHVERRPLTLVRARGAITRDDALRSEARFVHHTAREQRFVPAGVPRIAVEEKKKTGEYAYVDSNDALLALIDAGVVEWHVWNARVDDVERPDRVVFDIDPGAGVEWKATVAAARRLRGLLEEHELASWVKTTGGKGLHVVAPFRREHDWDSVFEFSRTIAARMADANPDRYIIAFDRAERRGKILLDYKRNYRTSIAVAGFSTRAYPNAPLSVPITWEELGRIGRSDRWTVMNIRERLDKLSDDPWRDYWTTTQRLTLQPVARRRRAAR